MINQYSTYLNNLKQLELIKLGSSKTLKTLDIKLKLEQKIHYQRNFNEMEY